MKNIYSLENYDYSFPKELIAQEPLSDRSSSRLMALSRATGAISHEKFTDIINHISPGDCLVMNDTKVLPANLDGASEKTGAKIGILVLDNTGDNKWDVIMKNSKRVMPGDIVSFNGGLKLTVIEKKGKIVEVEFNCAPRELVEKLWRLGTMPLPPYIKANIKDPSHRERYQTIYAKNEGAKAAPTAGLHFTPEILRKMAEKQVKTAYITLHVGMGTFESVEKEDIREHKMHSELFEITPENAEIINSVNAAGKKVIAIGTTSMRALEASSSAGREVIARRSMTDIFIFPGYDFKICGGLITNFHLPRTSLLALVSAFAGNENIKRAYEEAIKEKYRLFSYGDAMVII